MFNEKELIFTAETTPDLSMNLESSVQKIIPLIGLADAVNITDSPNCKTKLSSILVASEIKKRGLDVILQLTGRDRNRIAIYGGSYGGYATLMGLVKEPDLYAAGVDYVGVSNMFTFMKTIPPYWEPMLEMMYEMVGDLEEDSTMLKEVSPVFHVDKIKSPLFIAQGKNDPRVNVDESDQMVEAMKNRGVEVEYLVKDDEGHGFRNEENRFEFYRAMENFLSKQLN